jgi:hypothetical protein
MSRTRAIRTAVVSLALVAALTVAASASAEDKEPVLRLRAFAVDLDNSGRTWTLDIVIDHWSTPQEIKSFQAASTEGGENALLKAMEKAKPRCGYVRTQTSIPWDLYFATETPLPGGGRRIVVATDRPVSFWEALNPSAVDEYKFSLAEIRLGPDGKGEGKAIPYARLSYDPDTRTFEVKNYETLPVRLTQVTVVGSKPQTSR